MVVEEVIARSLLLLRRILLSTESVVGVAVVTVVAVGCCECIAEPQVVLISVGRKGAFRRQSCSLHNTPSRPFPHFLMMAMLRYLAMNATGQ